MGVFYKRTNATGAIVGMIGGLLITIWYIGAVKFGWPSKIDPWFGIKDQGAGLFGMIFNFASCIVLSHLTAPPSQKIMTMVDHLRFPKQIEGHEF